MKSKYRLLFLAAALAVISLSATGCVTGSRTTRTDSRSYDPKKGFSEAHSEWTWTDPFTFPFAVAGKALGYLFSFCDEPRHEGPYCVWNGRQWVIVQPRPVPPPPLPDPAAPPPAGTNQ